MGRQTRKYLLYELCVHTNQNLVLGKQRAVQRCGEVCGVSEFKVAIQAEVYKLMLSGGVWENCDLSQSPLFHDFASASQVGPYGTLRSEPIPRGDRTIGVHDSYEEDKEDRLLWYSKEPLSGSATKVVRSFESCAQRPNETYWSKSKNHPEKKQTRRQADCQSERQGERLSAAKSRCRLWGIDWAMWCGSE